jgi:murein DD-endopeptidase MepM/ murein hydrolase activator NlpD
MSGWRKSVSIILHRDGELKSTTYRVPLWLLRGAVAGVIGLAVVLVAGVAFYGPIVRQAARVPGLTREVDRLTTDNAKIRTLAAALDSVEANYARLRTMVGADIAPDPVVLGSPLPIAPALVIRPAGLRPHYENVASMPRHWPLDDRGYVTRGQVAGDSAEDVHPGLDVAVSVGALVRAAGGGTVLQTGIHPEYGLFVLIQHPSGYQSMYGHLSRVVTAQGRSVKAGEVIGRSGNSGRSSAPHLHFEVRVNGVSVDPLTMITEDR